MKKIAIVGTASNTVNLAPFEDDSWQIWSLGRNYGLVPRQDVWFELHGLRELKAAGVVLKHFEHLKKLGSKLLIMNPEEELPEAQIFPKESIVNDLGEYFTSSIAWMVGLAIHIKADEIGVWGVNMSNPEEYLRQKGCCEALLKIAEERGIKITIPDGSPLLKGAMYPNDIIFDLETRHKAAKRDYQKHRDEMNRFLGMDEILNELRMFYG